MKNQYYQPKYLTNQNLKDYNINSNHTYLKKIFQLNICNINSNLINIVNLINLSNILININTNMMNISFKIIKEGNVKPFPMKIHTCILLTSIM